MARSEPETLRLARSLLDDNLVQEAAKYALDDTLYSSLLQEGVVVDGGAVKNQPTPGR